MVESSDRPTPPEGLPEAVASDLSDLSPEELRNAVVFARELLQHHHEGESPVTPAPGEDILRVTEHDGYTEVVKQFDCPEGCSDCPHGPYLYHVTEEPQIEGGAKPHWSFLGRVEVDEE
ncbi:hypothetical protein [Halobacterium sp. R2-5]|uniref:hypothetical protein n=1 Tax=Halobacterium sp. R2-5 TaxID=2715751 RepID=UPI0014226BF8|nr:hypothetical protein [Halobacterium sp. R2-5]NIC00028.1 hypothetical protein [Halobacterium sp. R2-5]